MKWNKLRLVGVNNVDLPVLGADPSGPFILKGVEGLDPPPVDISIAKVRGQRGVRRLKEPQYRQIVALVGLQPEWDSGQSSSDLRSQMYGLLEPKYGAASKAQIMLDDTVICEAEGDVSNIDASIFSKDPEVQVTLDCDYAYLLAPSEVLQTPTRTTDGAYTILDIENEGDAPAGFRIEFTLQQAVSHIVLQDYYIFGRSMTISGPHAAGDAFIIDTRAGSRKISKINSGQTQERSVLNDLSPGSQWLTLHQGDNKLRLNVVTFDWRPLPFLHRPMWQGV